MDYGVINNLGNVDLKIANQVQGDILYFNGTDWVRLAPGTAGQVLKTQGPAANPIYGQPVDLAISSQAIGDILYFNGTNWVRLAAGAAGRLLQANGAAAPTWVPAPSGAQGAAICSFRGLSGSSNGSSIITYTESFDVGSNFNHTTGIFTAPQDGKYLFTNYGNFYSSSQIVYGGYIEVSIGGALVDGHGGGFNSGDRYPFGGSIVLNLSQNNTVNVTYTLSGISGSIQQGAFSGSLLA